MRTTVISVIAATALLGYRSAMLAAPEQTPQPSQATQARVWVQNHGEREAVPVAIESISRDFRMAPLRVRVVNAETAAGRDEPVRVRLTSTAWLYRTIVLNPQQAGAGAATALAEPGLSGWEATGIAFVAADGTTTLLLKRPQQ